LGNSASGIVDGPLLDPIAETLYVFVGDNMGGTGSAVFLFNAAASISASSGSTVTLGTGSTTVPVYDGTFDNIYFNSANGAQPTGNLYACGNAGGNPTLYAVQITYSAGANHFGTVTTGPALAGSNVGCSPLSEFYNSNTSTDWLFVGVPANSCGVAAGSAGGCVMNFNITSALSASTPGPWTPTSAYALNAQVVDSNGNIQKCTGGGCGDPGSWSGANPPTWSTTVSPTTSDGVGLSANSSVGTVTCTGCTVGTGNNYTISLKNITANPIAWSCAGSNCSSVTMSPASGSGTPLAAGATGTIAVGESGNGSPNVQGQTITIGSIAYIYETTAFDTTASLTSPQVNGNCTGCHPEMAQNLFAAITGTPANCTYGTGCYAPFLPLTWTYQGASAGQAAAPEPTGTSGIIIDNSGSGTGEANIYFGTLSGTGQTNSGVKMTQSGLL
jgi:hypothetical protein